VFFIEKNLPLQNQQVNFNQTWYKSSLGKGILNCTNKAPGPLQKGDNNKNAKNWRSLKKNFLENHWARIVHIYRKAF
jgi:hypothetical protein